MTDGFKRDDEGRLIWRCPPFSRCSYTEPDEALWDRYRQRWACKERVMRDWSSSHCGHPAKYDPDENGIPTKCWHHSAAAKERRQRKRDEQDAKWRAGIERKAALGELKRERAEIVVKIAEGHKDPRGLCQDWLDRWNKLVERDT